MSFHFDHPTSTDFTKIGIAATKKRLTFEINFEYMFFYFDHPTSTNFTKINVAATKINFFEF